MLLLKFFMLGTHMESQKETAEFLLELPRPYDIYFYSLNCFPGTALTKKSLEDGSLDPNLVEGKATKAWRQFRVTQTCS